MKRVLIAEDDRTTRHLLRGVLQAAGFDVAVAPDGAAALKALRKQPRDLLLLDVWMPKMNGLELLARLRLEPERPRAIVMTSDDTPETLLRAVREQAYHYVRKPVDPKAIVELVRDALAASPVQPPIEVISAKPNWVELLVPCEFAAAARIETFLAHLKSDLPEKTRERVGLAFRELLANAIEWGGKLDPNQKVRISFVRARRMLMYRIADPGSGFHFEGLTHAALKNPPDRPLEHFKIREDKGLRPGGLGILLVRSMVDELLYNEAQNEVLCIKYLEG
jgi:CheY-like chemotaxis protein/anti-sigma regulatory factor (Ser/Thr protein kinase)